jgi:hypothetical protein
VVAGLELGRDRDPPAAVGLGQDVDGERADPDVATDLAQAADAELLGELVEVDGEPVGEAGPVALEDGARVDLLEPGDLHGRGLGGHGAAT